MKIICNKSMQKLLGQSNLIDREISPIEKSGFNENFQNKVLEPVTEDCINYLDSVINVKHIKKREKYFSHDEETMYFNSFRIDEFHVGEASILSMLIYSIIVGTTWISNLKQEYPDDIFVVSICFDEGEEEDEVPPGFFVKCLHKRDYLEGYEYDIEKLKFPWLLMENEDIQIIKKNQYTCISCGFFAFEEAFSDLDKCPICGWEDGDSSSLVEYYSEEDFILFLSSQQKVLSKIPFDVKKYKKGKTLYKRNPLWKPVDPIQFNRKYGYFPRWKFEEVVKDIPNYPRRKKTIQHFREHLEKIQKYNPDEKVHKK